MNKLIIVVALSVLVGGCSEHIITGPDPIEVASTEIAQPVPVVVVPVEPAPSPAVPNAPEECRAIYNTFHEPSGDGLSIVVKNLCLSTPKEYLFVLFNVALDGFQTLIGQAEAVLQPGEQRTLTVELPFVHTCSPYQSDLFVEITSAQVVSGEAKINPNQEGQSGYVSPIFGKVYNGKCW